MNRMKLVNKKSLVRSARTQQKGPADLVLLLTVLFLGLAWGARAQTRRAATAVAVVANGSVAGVVVTDGGAGYVTAPNVTFIGGGGTGASASTTVTNGAVSSVILQSRGQGYTDAPTVAIDPPPPIVVPAVISLSLVPELVVTGQAWAVQQIQYAVNLGGTNQWRPLTNIVLGDSPYVMVDLSASSSMRLYRVVTLAAPGPDPTRWAWVNPGTFIMGSPVTEYDRSVDEGPQTQVTFTQGFWMERFEVTQGEYTAIVGTNYSTFAGDTNRPVEQVSWYDASNYCAQLTVLEQTAGSIPGGYVFRLPTEAEWEYAVRAGTTNRFFFGDDHDYIVITNYAWIATNSMQTTHDVGQKKPNPWGIYDTSGNVWEWCADWYGPYPGGSVTNPTGATLGTNRVMRGGSWHFTGDEARSATREFNPPDFASFGVGIRVVLAPPQP